MTVCANFRSPHTYIYQIILEVLQDKYSQRITFVTLTFVSEQCILDFFRYGGGGNNEESSMCKIQRDDWTAQVIKTLIVAVWLNNKN